MREAETERDLGGLRSETRGLETERGASRTTLGASEGAVEGSGDASLQAEQTAASETRGANDASGASRPQAKAACEA